VVGSDALRDGVANVLTVDRTSGATVDPTIPEIEDRMKIQHISARTVMNSLARPVLEVVVTLEDGTSAFGSAPEGETTGRFEDRTAAPESLASIVAAVDRDPSVRAAAGQSAVDAALSERPDPLPNAVSLGISLAYLHAMAKAGGVEDFIILEQMAGSDRDDDAEVPRLLLNVLNGGAHARTNPVLSDFPEFLLVPCSSDVDRYVEMFHAIDRVVRERLAGLDREIVDGAIVHVAPSRSNRVWIELLIDVLGAVGVSDEFELMIDASAGDLVDGDHYHFRRTDGARMDTPALVDHWVSIAREYPIAMIEDPFAEDDEPGWAALAATIGEAMVVGDNLTSTDAARIGHASRNHLIGATLIKPNQAGTVTATMRAVASARASGIAAIPSHRSVETDDDWLADLCLAIRPRHAKLGLLSDFATIQKVNRILRHAPARGIR
jgi:enolase 1/2/3